MSNTETKTAYPKVAGFPGVKDGGAPRSESEINMPAGGRHTYTSETFQLAGIEFIKFPDVNGMTPVITRNVQFYSRFGAHNDLRESKVLERMKEEFLPKIVETIGEENVYSFQTDLTTQDGLKPYGVMESKISLPTMDFYRANVEIFDKYPVDAWWWLATPESAKPHDDPWWIRCVSPSGYIDSNCYYRDCGVRPFLFLNSSIFESSEE